MMRREPAARKSLEAWAQRAAAGVTIDGHRSAVPSVLACTQLAMRGGGQDLLRGVTICDPRRRGPMDDASLEIGESQRESGGQSRCCC